MDILAENSAFQNLGLCLEKKCKDVDQIDDFLQLCIQFIFYEKISLSGLVPDYIAQKSSGIIGFLKEKYGLSNIDFQYIKSDESEELLKEVGKIYCSQMGDKLSEYKSVIDAKGFLPQLNEETLERLRKCTEAINKNSIDIIFDGELYMQSKFSIDSALIKIINYEGEIFSKLVEFARDNEWNETMAFQLISDLRLITNKLLTKKNNKIYSPAVKRGRKEKQILEKKILQKIDNLAKDTANILVPSIEMPSIKDYLINKGKGKPDEIMKNAGELRYKFKTVRDYIQEIGKGEIYGSLQTLNEISTEVIEQAKMGKPSQIKKVVENIHDVALGPVSISVPDISEINREKKLNFCVSAFTETINDMFNFNDGYYYKELMKNCME